MKVRNVNGTSDHTCECGSRLEHWRRFSKQPLPNFCCEKSCTQKPVVGAYVQREGSTDRGLYIVPLCEEHNGEAGKTLNVSENIALVFASTSELCGR